MDPSQVSYNACQPRSIGCTACCGLYNLELNIKKRNSLLQNRTEIFSKVDLNATQEIVNYRNKQEEQEKNITRKNPEIYVCPFLGLIQKQKPGCMLHPSITKNQKSQNFSFYGASICQTYDCRVKEKDDRNHYSKLISKYFPNSDIYGRLYPDFQFYEFFNRQEGLILELFKSDQDSDKIKAFVYLCKKRMQSNVSGSMTSFEIYNSAISGQPSDYLFLIQNTESQFNADIENDQNGKEDAQVLDCIEILFGNNIHQNSNC